MIDTNAAAYRQHGAFVWILPVSSCFSLRCESREERTEWSDLAIETRGTNRTGEGEKSLRWDTGAELRLGGGEEKKGDDILVYLVCNIVIHLYHRWCFTSVRIVYQVYSYRVYSYIIYMHVRSFLTCIVHWCWCCWSHLNSLPLVVYLAYFRLCPRQHTINKWTTGFIGRKINHGSFFL